MFFSIPEELSMILVGRKILRKDEHTPMSASPYEKISAAILDSQWSELDLRRFAVKCTETDLK